MHADEKRWNEITEKIIGAAFRVGNKLGCGFMEKVYENALAHEIRKLGLRVQQQVPMTVWYDGVIVGEYIADLVVEDEILVELKAARAIDEAHTAQCLNYLTATKKPICLLINFYKRVEIKRIARYDTQTSQAS